MGDLHVYYLFFFELDHVASGILMGNVNGVLKKQKGWGRRRGGEGRKRNPDADAGLWRKTGRRRRETECVRVGGLKKTQRNQEDLSGRPSRERRHR